MTSSVPMGSTSNSATMLTNLVGTELDLDLDLRVLYNRVKVLEQNGVLALQSDNYLRNR